MFPRYDNLDFPLEGFFPLEILPDFQLQTKFQKVTAYEYL